jgi:hypothetical protein
MNVELPWFYSYHYFSHCYRIVIAIATFGAKRALLPSLLNSVPPQQRSTIIGPMELSHRSCGLLIDHRCTATTSLVGAVQTVEGWS